MARGHLRRALSEASIRSYILGMFCSNIGTWAQRLTVGWLVFEFTGSAAWVGAIAACEALPALLVAPFAGAVADRLDRVHIFAVGLSCALLQAVALMLLAAADLLSIEVFILAALALGLIDGFNQPTRLSLISNIAPGEFRATAIALNSLSFNAARFVGPAVGGAALAVGGPVASFGLNVVSFVPLIAFLVLLLRRGVSVAGRPASRPHDGIIGGVRYTVTHALIGPVLFLLLVMSLLARPIVELLPAISGIWFDSSPATLAALTASVGLGAMIGGVLMAQITRLSHLLTAAIWIPAGLVLTNLLIAAGDGLVWTTYPLLVFAGMFVACCAIATQSVIHMTADPAYLGRVLSLYGLIQRAIMTIGAFLIGTMTDLIGLAPALGSAAAVATIGWLIVWRRRRQLHTALADAEARHLRDKV